MAQLVTTPQNTLLLFNPKHMRKYWKKFKVPFYSELLFVKKMVNLGYKVTKVEGGLFNSVYRVSGYTIDVLYL